MNNTELISKELKEKIKNSKIQTPYYVVDENLLTKNLETLKRIEEKTGAKILLAQKGFSMYSLYFLISKYISGVTSSSLNEAHLGYDEMKQKNPHSEVHIYSPAYIEQDFDEIMDYCEHIVFNSFSQYMNFRDKIKNHNTENNKKIECGIRINPEYSEIETDIYNPCFEYSRMGITLKIFEEELEKYGNDILKEIDGLHFHTMCEQNSDTLQRTLEKVEEKFGKYIKEMKWLNFGGGHHITRADYNIKMLTDLIINIKNKYNVRVYLEPGEAVALNTGFLVSSVLDTMKNGIDIAITDVSAACHMPDVLEMPYRPNIVDSGKKDEYEYTYRLGGATCLAGDITGDYSFKTPLSAGDKLIFCDMAHYSMVKNNTFNGVNLPSIVLYTIDGELKLLKSFGYDDFKSRL